MAATNQKDTVTIGTKISREAKDLLSAIAGKSGLTMYVMLQVVIDCYLRYVSNEVEVTNSMNDVLNGFANFSLAKDSFCVCEGGETNQCDVIISFMSKKGSTLPQAVLYRHDKGQVYKCYRNDEMLTLFLSAIAPDLLPILGRIKNKENLLSITDALKFAVKEQEEPTLYNISDDIRSMLSDNSRDVFGGNIDYSEAGQYVRVFQKSCE